MSQLFRFVFDLSVFGVITAILAGPVVIVALREGLTDTVRRFALVGGAVALGCALLSLGSEALVGRCRDAGNTGCLDYGALGMQVLVLGVYGAVSLLRAFTIARN